ncbi:MAG TPA: hypothetical protein VL326_23385 [Kofleriaceae bacterium]|nr:hypothetical protein [Kofleriaceae bacterium]
MRNAISTASVLVVVAALVGCLGGPPPPPELKVTSPQRGLIQSEAGTVTVTGTAVPGSDGAVVASVSVNGTKAKLAADGSFSVDVDVSSGAMLIETTATSIEGAKATDARAVQVGQKRAVGSMIDRALAVSVSAEAFAKLAATAGPLVKGTDFNTLLAPMQPMASFGDSIANVKLSITKLTLGDVKLTMTPVDGGLELTVELTNLSVAAKAAYAGTLVPDGTTTVNVSADKVTIAGTLTVTPAGVTGFTTKLASPAVQTTNLKLQASGLIGDILDLLQDNLSSTVQKITTSSIEKALQPAVNAAFGALAGPKQLNVLGKQIEFQVSPSVVTFSRAGALASLNLAVKIGGSEASPGFIYTPNGTPSMTVGDGIQLGLADDLMNEMLAEVHALGLLDIHLAQDFGLFDVADIKLAMPPMINANTGDGKMRLVLGDMVASFTDHGKPLITAALNAQVDLAVDRGDSADQIALQFGKIHAFVNVTGGDDGNDVEVGGSDLTDAANTAIAVQLDSLSKFMVTVPIPTLAGVQLDSLSLHGDSGYVVVAGDIH